MGVEGLELGQVLGIETVVHRDGMEAVTLRDAGKLLRAGVYDVDPDEVGIVPLYQSADGHPAQIRLAAAAAPNPLSMLTTVPPAAQEFSIPRRAARPPKEA